METNKIESTTTLDLREQLKKILESEIKSIPAMLDELESKDRLAFVSRLMPYILPRVDSIHYSQGETPWD